MKLDSNQIFKRTIIVELDAKMFIVNESSKYDNLWEWWNPHNIIFQAQDDGTKIPKKQSNPSTQQKEKEEITIFKDGLATAFVQMIYHACILLESHQMQGDEASKHNLWFILRYPLIFVCKAWAWEIHAAEWIELICTITIEKCLLHFIASTRAFSFKKM